MLNSSTLADNEKMLSEGRVLSEREFLSLNGFGVDDNVIYGLMVCLSSIVTFVGST